MAIETEGARARNTSYRKFIAPHGIVPNLLDSSILQSGEDIMIEFKGPKDNLDVKLNTPNGKIPLNSVVPQGTKFAAINMGSEYEYHQSQPEKEKIFIPLNRNKPNPVLDIIHGCAHAWSRNENQWNASHEKASKTLRDTLIIRGIYGDIQLPGDKEEEQQHLEAWQVLGEEEFRSSAITFFMIGKLRDMGFDLFPQYPSVKLLVEKVINPASRFYQQYKQKLKFTEKEVAEFLAGNFPIPTLEQKIVSHLNQAVQSAVR